MVEENKPAEATDKETTSQETTEDTTLVTAADVVSEEVVSEEQGAEEVIEEEEELVIDPPENITEQKKRENDDKSQLGRKLAAMHRDQTAINTQTVEALQNINKALLRQMPAVEEEIDLDEPMTRRDVQAFYQKQNEQETNITNDYNKVYLDKIQELFSSEDKSIRGGLVEIFESKFNIGNSSGKNDPVLDAQINFERSQAAFYRGISTSPTKKVNPMKGAKPASPIGGATTTTMKKNVVSADLGNDKLAQSLTASMKDEDVAEILAVK